MKMTSFARHFAITAFALGGTLPSAYTVARADDSIRTVALSARPAPGTATGVSYASFDLPVLNNLGRAAFAASVTGAGVDNTNGGGIWSEASGSLAAVVRSGSPAPGTAGLKFRGVGGRLVLSDTGRHAFEASLADATQYDEQGIWSDGTGALALVARQGNPAAGTPGGVHYSGLNPGQSLVSNRAAQAAFTADLQSGGLPWGAGLFAGSAGNVRAVALSGNHAPGTPSGSVFATFGGPALNDAGRTAFLAALEPGSNGVIYRVNHTGVWSEGSAGTVVLVARAGSQAPGTPGGVTFGPEFFPPAFNNAGRTAFAADLAGSGVNTTNDTGLWYTTPTGLQLVARSGTRAPGTPAGVTFANFYGGFPALNDAGHIAILTYVTGSGIDSTNDRGIWSGDPAGLGLITRTGDHAPGTAAGVNFAGLTEPALNNAGQLAFRASLVGAGFDDTNGVGIWATDATGALRLIVRAGGVLEVGTGDFRTIDDLDMILRHGSSDGRASAFNDLGQLVFRASFTDGSEGVFVSDRVAVPEPGGLVVCGLALAALLRRRAR